VTNENTGGADQTDVGSPQPTSGPNSFINIFSGPLAKLRKYRAALLAENVEQLIHVTAANPAVSQQVITKVQSEAREARRILFRICSTSVIIPLALLLINGTADLITRNIFHVPWNDNYLGSRDDVFTLLFVFVLLATVAAFAVRCFLWREDHIDAWVADSLIRTLEAGLLYQDASTDSSLRDRFAISLQQAAIIYYVGFKRSSSSGFFAAQVRSQARKCRNDIMSMVPGLVTAGQEEIAAINSNLARLLIRSQTGYWHQTSDIAERGAPVPRRDAIQIFLISFFRERQAQLTILAVAGTLAAAIISAIVAHLKLATNGCSTPYVPH
jgi:hypothetical protein